MKITLNKSAKRALSLVLALAMLVGSLFVANVGVTFDAKAETEGIVLTWDGNVPDSFSDTEHLGNSAEDAIIISTPADLAYLVKNSQDESFITLGKYYKVADNSVFDMGGLQGITLDSTLSDVSNASGVAANNWASITYHNLSVAGFRGTFDGNGLIIYNLYADGHASALFTCYGGSAVIKNIHIKNSKITGSSSAAAILGTHSHKGQPEGEIATVENCMVENCNIYSTYTQETYYMGAGSIVSSTRYAKHTVNNCLDINNTITVADANVSTGIVGHAQSASYANVNNCVSIGSNPVGSKPATYSNVYTDNTVSQTGVTTLSVAQMTGTAATENMALDFDSIWFANTAGVPVLRAFHNISATDNGNGTHSEVCADAGCGLIGLTANHLYNIVDYTTDTSSCACGDFIYGTNDVWDGTKASAFDSGSGTETDPYIIKTVEQLFLMVRSTGINDDGTPVYYKVADSVNELYINDTRGFKDQAAFEAAVGTLKNWSTGLTTEAQLCGSTDSCYSAHYNDVYTSSSTKVLNNHRDGYVDYFGGRFDGNGVTIYGLYSMTTAANHWNNGTGFVPMLTGNAVIKNVTFDTSYVKSNSANAAVITATVGIWDGQYNKDTDGNSSYETFVMCPRVDAYAKRPENCNAAIINVAVRNSYLSATNYTDNSFVSGFVSSIRAPKSLKFDNCLFDGTNTTITDTASTDKHYAFVVTHESNTNSTVTGCVSIAGGSSVTGLNSYTGAYNTVVNCYELDSNEFTVEDAQMLNWLYWEAGYGNTTLKNNASWTADYYRNQGDYNLSWRKNKVITSTDEYAGFDFSKIRNNRGVFEAYNTLTGSGTEADPYIINDADTLYLIIASGGTKYGVPQHFKLGCNIDLEGKQWVDTDIFENTTYDVVFYQYVPFAGILDGDGHTISNLYSARVSGMDDSGFIPTLAATGVVKNINFRNCYAYDDSNGGGIIAGTAESGAQIIDCSLENCLTGLCDLDYGYQPYFSYADLGEIVFEGCYMVNSDGSASYADGTAPTLGENWYGIEGGIARLVSFAKAQPCADIDADGIGEEYAISDVTALKNNLLWEDGYDYIYGDVTGNGTIDMRDLAALQREMTGQETIELDGFWPNVKSGKFSIYYDDKDNYDFARKLELYLESKAGVDLPKTFGTSDSNFTISFKTEGDADAYSVKYEPATAKLIITGGSFTAVEEAVDQIIAQTTLAGVPAISGTIATEKNAILLNGSTYYYAWGDEFNADVNGTVSYDKWMLRNKGTDKTPGEIDSEFEYIREATDAEALGINVVEDGKLALKRGFATNDADGYKFYMSGIGTRESMLFKQGYLEMVATVPSDGYAFPAWWLLTHNEGRGNDTIDNSLFSKVYELNESYDTIKAERNPTPTDVTTYKYKLPTQTLEMDLFEIIQRPTLLSKLSDDHNIKFNIHKWYTYSLVKTDTSLTVYDLDWSKNLTSGAFPTELLTATGSNGENYAQSSASININTGNLAGGSVNGAVTYQGDLVTMQYDMESLRNESGQITSRKYGFLWTEDEMTFIVYTDATGTNELHRETVTKDQMNFGGSENYYNNDNFGFNQYAYMLIENHIFTAQKGSYYWYQAEYDNIEDCDLVIDYVRIYQLDGARNIITPESESIYDR